MSDRMRLGIFLIAVVLLGFPILGKLAAPSGEQPGAAQQDTGKNAGKAGAKGAKGGKGAPPAPAQLEPPLLNASNLPNTQWQMTISGFPVKVTFLAGGQVAADAGPLGQIQGTWSVNGADLTVSATAMGQSKTETVKISGNNIIVNGKPAQRLR